MSSEGYVPYGWQLAGERVRVLAQRGYEIKCWGLERLIATQTDNSITERLARFINQLPPRQREIIFLE